MAPGDERTSLPAYAERLAWLEAQEAETPAEQRGRRLAVRAWTALWPKVLAIAIVLAVWQLIHVSGWKKLIFPGPGGTLADLWDQLQTGLLWHAIGTTAERAVIGFGLAVVIGVGHRRAGLPDRAAAGGGRLADHRAADDAVDRLVPVRDHPVRHQHHRHLVRHRARRGPVDRQRPDRGRGLHPAAAAAGGQDDGAAQALPVPVPDPAGLAARVRGRAAAGLGVRLAQPDGRRTAGHHREPAVPGRAAVDRPGSGRHAGRHLDHHRDLDPGHHRATCCSAWPTGPSAAAGA